MKLGVFGSNIAYSVSPQLHQVIGHYSGLSSTYNVYDAKGDFEKGFKTLREGQVDGYNVTIPYKEDIMSKLDRIDSRAKAIGSVNTVAYEEGQWVGYNTDGQGFVEGLKMRGLSLHGLRVLVLGAGGAAKSVVYEVLEAGAATVLIYNRSKERRNRLFTQMTPHFDFGRLMVVDDYQGCVVDLVINTTPLGGLNEPGKQAVDLESLSCKYVADIVYKPYMTPLLNQAKALGYQTYHGIDMLVCQALRAQEIWNKRLISDQIKREVADDMQRKLAHL